MSEHEPSQDLDEELEALAAKVPELADPPSDPGRERLGAFEMAKIVGGFVVVGLFAVGGLFA